MTDSGLNDHQRAVQQRLNETFFGSSPAKHFRSRVDTLSQLGDAIESGSSAPPAGFTADILSRLPNHSVVPDDEARDAEHMKAALTIESFMLAHHAVETFLRMLFAVEDAGPGRPHWLAISSRDRRFRERAETLRKSDDDKLQPFVEWAFIGDVDHMTAAAGAERVAGRTAHVSRWLRQSADFHLQSSSAYNAAKHGLALKPSHARISFRLDPPETSEIEFLAGATLDTLESEGKGQEREWFRVTHVVDPAGLLAMTLVVADLIESLWAVARARQLGEPALVSLMDEPSLRKIVAGHEKEWGTFKVPIGALPLAQDSLPTVLADVEAHGGLAADREGESKG
jgi:hypothetical protein